MVPITLGNPNTKKPLTRALQTVLAGVIGVGKPDRRLAIFSYEDDFSQLWGIDQRGAEPAIPLDTDDVVVVIRERANGPVTDLPEAGRYLTVRDWAVWLCLSRWHSGRKNIPSIILVDATPVSRTSGNCHADRFFQMFADCRVPDLPWIKTVPVVNSPGQPCCLLQLIEAVQSIVSEALIPKDLSLVQQLWQSFFLHPSRPSDNHALANLLGAGLLTGQIGGSPVRQALAKHLQNLNLIPRSIDRQSATSDEHIIVRTATEIHGRLSGEARKKLHFFLVDDDQRRHNWASFVAQNLGLKQPSRTDECWTGTIGPFQAQLSANEFASELLNALNSAIVNSEGLRELNGSPGELVDVLFLDLRLFERAPLNVEAEFFTDVIKLLRHVSLNPQDIRGDQPRLDTSELDQIEAWCKFALISSENATRNDGLYIDALTLLPRLVSIIDSDLPIVLFSSTQRRRVADALKPYRNIITEFSKPALQLGQSSEQIQECLASFGRATAKALNMVHARRLRRLLLQRQFPVYWRGHVEKPIDEESREPWSIQLLIDETERNGTLTVGGFLVIYPPGVCPEKINREIYHAHPEIRDGKHNNRKQNLSSVLWKSIEILASHQVLAIPISLSGQRTTTTTAHSNWEGSSVFRDELVADNLHRELMRCVIELGLFVFARQILPEKAVVEFHFHAPTRVLPVSKEEASELNLAWGIDTFEGKDGRLFARHFDRNSARSLLEEVFRDYHGATFEPKPMRSRAFGLSDDAHASEKRKVYALHYLADGWLNDHSSEELSQLRDLAVEGDYGPKLSRLLEAHRCILTGQTCRAIAIGAPVALSLKQSQLTTAVNSVVVALQDAASVLSGEETMALAAILAEVKREQKDERLEGVVQSISSVDGSVKIDSGGRTFVATRKQLKTELNNGEAVRFSPRRGNRVGTFVAMDVSRIDLSAKSEAVESK